ncbi:MAG: hypothetical protein ACTS8R_01410 [Arsenophonus sp. NC-QC1-MAG3]
MHYGYSLGLQQYRCKIHDCRKTFNNLTVSIWRSYIKRINSLVIYDAC